jgi:hypothetical protein
MVVSGCSSEGKEPPQQPAGVGTTSYMSTETKTAPNSSTNPAPDRTISQDDALSIARNHTNVKANVTWNAILDPHRTIDTKAGHEEFPAWVVEEVFPMGNKTVFLIHAVTGEIKGVMEVEAR